ncbi:lysosomal amino acid transporter 1 homolog isoform X3 [Phycodurus eques]|uniref:lysosomal amino acid transporter 1 homolog isoform X3 n=1 Tax=Phycodurus eques TaxID=693459 RepID=UPI002ACE6511|nr:lysosomal amino acid transporter 1 homolog isoform X3 [Phycodurus eques]
MLKDGVLTNVPFGWAAGGNLTILCPNGSKWVWEGLGECAQDARDMASVYLGLLSILCFMMSSLPQYYSSCKTGNMDSALSIWFLLLWLGGDSCNLVGSFLADQLPLQTYTAVYYVLADLLMLAMYLYYKMKNRMGERVFCTRWAWPSSWASPQTSPTRRGGSPPGTKQCPPPAGDVRCSQPQMLPRLLPPKRSSASPLARYRQCSICFPDFLRYALISRGSRLKGCLSSCLLWSSWET